MCDILIASVVIRLLFTRCIKSTRNSSKLTAVGWIPHHLQLRHDPISPRFVLLIGDGCSLLVFSPPKGLLSLSLPLAFVAEMCYQPLTSPPSLPKLRTDRLFKKINSRLGSDESPQEEKSFKKEEKRKGKENVTKMLKIPRNVSTFLAGEKATPAVRLSF